MDANEFVTKLKANGNKNDWCEMENVYEEYKLVKSKLSTKHKCSFSLNVLCTLCRNLDKIPTWRDKIDIKLLLLLSIDCVRETRGSERPDHVKTLACIYHIHKHVVKQPDAVAPELVIKLSMMPFENDDLLKEYCKTYWNILADRFTFIEKLKSNQMKIVKLLPKLTEDLLKVTIIYDTVPFCSNILLFIVRKLHFLYSDNHAKDINNAIGEILEAVIHKKDLHTFKPLKPVEIIDLYLKFNECFYIIIDDSVKFKFKDSVFPTAVCCCLKLLGHQPDVFHCLQTFYQNTFCYIFSEYCNTVVLENMVNSCKVTEKLGYAKAMTSTYPYLSQLLRLYIEFLTSNSHQISWKEYFDETIQESCLKIIEFFMKKLRTTQQISKCDGCPAKSGLHDGLRLSLLVPQFISISITEGISVQRVLPRYKNIILDQHKILDELKMSGCVNHEKCYRKVQSDTHNTAICLNKAQIFDFSIQLFDIYLENEIKNFKTDVELRNISRALYNKSICEMDVKKYEHALRDAFLSLTLAVPESLNSEKYMSLVMDIKAKAAKQQETNDEDDEKDEEVNYAELQLMNVFEACRVATEDSVFENLKPVLTGLKFSELLHHEFDMYARLWPSVAPVAGVWRALHYLSMNKYPDWMIGETQEIMLSTLHNVIISTAFSIRSIHSDYYINIVNQLIRELEIKKPADMRSKIVHATLLTLKCEMNLAKAAQKYGWNNSENADTGLGQVRTVPQEYEAILPGLRAVELWTGIFHCLKPAMTFSRPPPSVLRHALKIATVLVQELDLLYQTTPALQLAHVCCKIAEYVGDQVQYLRNFSVISSHCFTMNKTIVTVLKDCMKKCKVLLHEGDIENPAMFLCEAALFYNRCGEVGLSARIVRTVQAQVLSVLQKDPTKKLDLLVGRLREAQIDLCQDYEPTHLSEVNALHRHHVAIANTETTWLKRRYLALATIKATSQSSFRTVTLCHSLHNCLRARAAAVGCNGAVRRLRVAVKTVSVSQGSEAAVLIDNRLKHILGLQPSNEIQTQAFTTASKIKQQMSTPKQNRHETMLEHVVFKKTQTSPTFSDVSVPAFQMPEYMDHAQDCTCFSCKTPYTFIMAFKTFSLEAAVYFRAKEHDIAKNYFNGVLGNFDNIKMKLQNVIDSYRTKFEGYIVDLVIEEYMNDLNQYKVEFLIEAAYFSLTLGNYRKSEAYLKEILDLCKEIKFKDNYVKNEILNLTIVLNFTRNKTNDVLSLETAMQNLELTPAKVPIESQRTPESKAAIPPEVNETKLVPDEELPKLRRKVIKLNLDDDNEDTAKPRTRSNRNIFKIPVPVTAKPVLDNIGTPIPNRTKPDIAITRTSDEKNIDTSSFATPNTDKSKLEFFTPNATPAEQFFTPSTSIKTYSKKSLRHNIIKNLENEFSTPKADKENTKEHLELPSASSRRAKVDDKSKRSLKRATSPGKIVKDEKAVPVRSRRLKAGASGDK